MDRTTFSKLISFTTFLSPVSQFESHAINFLVDNYDVGGFSLMSVIATQHAFLHKIFTAAWSLIMLLAKPRNRKEVWFTFSLFEYWLANFIIDVLSFVSMDKETVDDLTRFLQLNSWERLEIFNIYDRNACCNGHIRVDEVKPSEVSRHTKIPNSALPIITRKLGP